MTWLNISVLWKNIKKLILRDKRGCLEGYMDRTTENNPFGYRLLCKISNNEYKIMFTVCRILWYRVVNSPLQHIFFTFSPSVDRENSCNKDKVICCAILFTSFITFSLGCSLWKENGSLEYFILFCWRFKDIVCTYEWAAQQQSQFQNIIINS